MNLNPKKILVIKLRHLGDVLLTTPIFSILKKQFPEAQIDAYVNEESRIVLDKHPAIGDVLGFERAKKEQGGLARVCYEKQMLDQIRSKGYDLVINLTEGDRGTIAAWYSKAPLRIGYCPKKPWMRFLLTQFVTPSESSIHVVEQNLDALRSLGIELKEEDKELFFATSKKEEQVVPKHLRGKPFVLIHPTSRWNFKCWPKAKLRELIVQLIQEKYAVIVTSGPGREEVAFGKAVAAHLNVMDLCGRVSLEELGVLIRASKVLLCVDSLPFHIASALKEPVLALFGPSSEKKWGPWRNEKARVLTKEMACRPCFQAGCQNSKRSECLETLSVEQVLSELKTML